MSNFDAPHVNGEMELTEEEKLEIRAKLIAIQEAFVPDPYHPVCDTQYLVATYNTENPDFVINGDTAQMILSEGITESPAE